MLTVRIQEKNYSESIMVLKLKDGFWAKFAVVVDAEVKTT